MSDREYKQLAVGRVIRFERLLEVLAREKEIAKRCPNCVWYNKEAAVMNCHFPRCVREASRP